LTKYQMQQFIKVPVKVPLEQLRQDLNWISNNSSCSKEIFNGRGCQILDLTYIADPLKKLRATPFVGTPTERALPNYLTSLKTTNTVQRLQVGRQTNPYSDDRNHNRVKEAFKDLPTIHWLQNLGDVSKITIATLRPNSWWPSHYDFSCRHASKANIPIFTNPEAVSLSWNPREKLLKEVHMKSGEFWFINPSFKHTAFNWGKESRSYLLVTFRKPMKHLDFL
jgi:hypothetical protein